MSSTHDKFDQMSHEYTYDILHMSYEYTWDIRSNVHWILMRHSSYVL